MANFNAFFFFFQAEDGIRDVAVTGVQTCALPISTCNTIPTRYPASWKKSRRGTTWSAAGATSAKRSEEHTSELQSRLHLVCRLLLEKKKKNASDHTAGVNADRAGVLPELPGHATD